jgi:uncharacterized protein with HEPN domain
MTGPRNIRVVIDEMVDHIDYILAKTESQSITEFRANRDVRQSVERSLEIISEASRHLPAEIQERKPEIPWRKIADLGNVLRHGYFAINTDLIWVIICESARPLRDALIDLRDSFER